MTTELESADAPSTNGKVKVAAGAAVVVLLLAAITYPRLRWSSFTGEVEQAVERVPGVPSEDVVAGLAKALKEFGAKAGYPDLQVTVTVESRMGANLSTKQFLVVGVQSDSRVFVTERTIEAAYDEEERERMEDLGVSFKSKHPKGHH